MKQHTDQPALKQLSLGLGMLGLCLGFLAAYGVLTGDNDGQVNLLLLLLLFAFVPVVGLGFQFKFDHQASSAGDKISIGWPMLRSSNLP